MSQAVDITLLGKTYRVACPEGEEQKLREASDNLAQRMSELKAKTKASNMENLAIMVGLNLSYELLDKTAENDKYTEEMGQRITQLQQTIEDALRDQGLPVKS